MRREWTDSCRRYYSGWSRINQCRSETALIVLYHYYSTITCTSLLNIYVCLCVSEYVIDANNSATGCRRRPTPDHATPRRQCECAAQTPTTTTEEEILSPPPRTDRLPWPPQECLFSNTHSGFGIKQSIASNVSSSACSKRVQFPSMWPSSWMATGDMPAPRA